MKGKIRYFLKHYIKISKLFFNDITSNTDTNIEDSNYKVTMSFTIYNLHRIEKKIS